MKPSQSDAVFTTTQKGKVNPFLINHSFVQMLLLRRNINYPDLINDLFERSTRSPFLIVQITDFMETTQ